MADKLKIQGCMFNETLSFARDEVDTSRDEVDTRYESVLEARAELGEKQKVTQVLVEVEASGRDCTEQGGKSKASW